MACPEGIANRLVTRMDAGGQLSIAGLFPHLFPRLPNLTFGLGSVYLYMCLRWQQSMQRSSPSSNSLPRTSTMWIKGTVSGTWHR